MKNLIDAMAEEKKYIEEKMNGIDPTPLADRLIKLGYDDMKDYFHDKKTYLFNNWYPQIYYIDVKTLTTELERAIVNEQFGVYISKSNGIYAFHGTDDIDYEFCKKKNIFVAELYYDGGTIIGSSADFGIEIVAPSSIGLDATFIMNKFHEIFSRYLNNVTINGNDIIVDGYKIMGSMRRNVGGAFVWAAQVSFADYTDIIEQICNKKSGKKPGYIDNDHLTRDVLESEVLKWLQKL